MRDSYSKYSDQELFDLLKLDDVEALNEIHGRFSPLLYAHAYKRYPYREEVRDLVQKLYDSMVCLPLTYLTNGNNYILYS